MVIIAMESFDFIALKKENTRCNMYVCDVMQVNAAAFIGKLNNMCEWDSSKIVWKS